MSFEDNVTISEQLRKRVRPIVNKHRGSVHVRDYDIVLKGFIAKDDSGTAIGCNAWALVVIVNGALVGPQHYISFVWTFGRTPAIPDDRALETGVREMFQRIRGMQSRQLRDANPGASPN